MVVDEFVVVCFSFNTHAPPLDCESEEEKLGDS